MDDIAQILIDNDEGKSLPSFQANQPFEVIPLESVVPIEKLRNEVVHHKPFPEHKFGDSYEQKDNRSVSQFIQDQ